MKKAVLLNAASKMDILTTEAASQAKSKLVAQGFEVDEFVLRDLAVKPCIGCFGCWVKTPGECIINDDGRMIAQRVIAADVFLVVTPISYGSYGSLAKNAIDRLICLVRPDFVTINEETHHEPRYDRYPSWLVLGTATSDISAEQNLLKRLVERNSINLYSKNYAAQTVVNTSQIPDAFTRLCAEARIELSELEEAIV